jgi:hypothetical protein
MEEKKTFADHEVFEQIKEPKNRFQGSLAGRYDNPIRTRFLILGTNDFENLGDYFLFLGKLLYGPFFGIF